MLNWNSIDFGKCLRHTEKFLRSTLKLLMLSVTAVAQINFVLL